jgi:hypothetical protein
MSCKENMPYPKPHHVLAEAVRHKNGMHCLESELSLFRMSEIAESDGGKFTDKYVMCIVIRYRKGWLNVH